MAKEQSQPDLGELARKTQALLVQNGAAGAQIERFRGMQDALLKEAETFARHCFERRHAATETAIEALHAIKSNGTADPAQAMRALTDWQRGSFERMITDMQEWTALCMRGAGEATTAQLDAVETAADQAEAGKANGKAAAKPRSGHATPV